MEILKYINLLETRKDISDDPSLARRARYIYQYEFVVQFSEGGDRILISENETAGVVINKLRRFADLLEQGINNRNT